MLRPSRKRNRCAAASELEAVDQPKPKGGCSKPSLTFASMPRHADPMWQLPTSPVAPVELTDINLTTSGCQAIFGKPGRGGCFLAMAVTLG
jgi:hypothetical protein